MTFFSLEKPALGGCNTICPEVVFPVRVMLNSGRIVRTCWCSYCELG